MKAEPGTPESSHGTGTTFLLGSGPGDWGPKKNATAIRMGLWRGQELPISSFGRDKGQSSLRARAEVEARH